MRSSQRRHRRAAALMVAAAALVTAQAATPAQAMVARSDGNGGSTACLTPDQTGGAEARGGPGGDHRPVSASEQASIASQTKKLLAAKRAAGLAPAAGVAVSVSVPVYIHVMLDKAGNGDVTQKQIDDQVAVLNKTYGGGESSAAADTGFTFSLAGVDRYKNSTWHRDGASTTYRSRTRLGGKNALNIWLVDFKYLGIATFPWDYAKSPKIDGIRVHFDSLPGGSINNYNLGETATHEAGHWSGLWHTFQGGCTTPNDEVADTAAQASPTTGCPEGRDSCTSAGIDPIHNYMDYSYDSCYNQFTPGQSTRVTDMWSAYRA